MCLLGWWWSLRDFERPPLDLFIVDEDYSSILARFIENYAIELKRQLNDSMRRGRARWIKFDFSTVTRNYVTSRGDFDPTRDVNFFRRAAKICDAYCHEKFRHSNWKVRERELLEATDKGQLSGAFFSDNQIRQKYARNHGSLGGH